MLDTKHLKQIRKHLHDYAMVRRDVIKDSGDMLHHAKRAIFELHAGNKKAAKAKITSAETLLKKLQKRAKTRPEIVNEGSYKQALEEYVEAILFMSFVTGKPVAFTKKAGIADEVFLAGLCDLPGELHRYAIKAATEGDKETVLDCADMATQIIGELIEFHLTKYLRTKFDQAKASLKRIEVLVYELSRSS